MTQMVEKIADEYNLKLPLPPAEFAVVLAALSDGLLVHWLNDSKAVPDNVLARFIIATVMVPSAGNTADP